MNEMNVWLKKNEGKADYYRTTVSSHAEAQSIIDSFLEAAEGKELYLYGAGTVGRNMVQLLQALQVPICGIFDRNAEKLGELNGYPVKPAEEVSQLASRKNAVLIVAVNRIHLPAIRDFLLGCGVDEEQILDGHTVNMLLQSAWCMLRATEDGADISPHQCWECPVLDHQCKSLRRYLRRINQYDEENSSGTDQFYMFAYTLGNICTLNCKNCSEGIPYYRSEQRSFVPGTEVIRDIKKLSGVCRFLTLLEFSGGEPFLHPDLPEILEECLTIPNIGVIHIFSNGTAAPNERLCRVLANRKISIYISNYLTSLTPDFRKRREKTIEKLSFYDVQFMIGKKENWYDFRSFHLLPKSEETLIQGYDDCFLHNCHRLYRGCLYVCPHQYAGINLGKLSPGADTIPIHDYSDEELVKQLERFRSFRYIDACRHCTMPYLAEQVLSGEQLKTEGPDDEKN